jgi:ProP effector
MGRRSDSLATPRCSVFREDAGLIEERSLHLLSALEAQAAHALDELRSYRAKHQALEIQLAEAEAARRELEAARLELVEENRELDEQNRELEEDNARLRERLRKGEPAPAFPGPARRAQGLAALIGQRAREGAGAQLGSQPASDAEPVSQASPASHAPSPARQQPAEPGPLAPPGTPQPEERGDRQGALAIEQAPSADALLKQWYQRYPGTFFKGHTRPLKVGIHHELAAREPWPEKLVRRALAGYVNLPRYLKAVREGAERIDLDGAPAGSVDVQAAEHARRKLERLQTERRERGRPAGGKPQRDGNKPRSSRQGAAKRQHDRARHSPKPQAATQPSAEEAPKVPADPKTRMEAKLSALLAKHNGQKTGGR